MKATRNFALLTLALATLLSSCAGGSAAKTGLGHVFTSENLDEGVRTDAVFCAASFDAGGKVLKVVFDDAQYTTVFENGAPSSQIGALKTKRDLGAAYGMKAQSGIGREWNEQVDELQKWMEGKTVTQITSMKQTEGKSSEPDLTSKVTIHVGDFLAALQSAWDNAK